MKSTRIYIVGHGSEIRLVRANHRAQALNHAAKTFVTVRVASQDELIGAFEKGVPIENAVNSEQLMLEI